MPDTILVEPTDTWYINIKYDFHWYICYKENKAGLGSIFIWGQREKTISHREVRKVSLRSITWIKFEWSEGAKLHENIMEFSDRTSSTKTLMWVQVGWILESAREEWDEK